MGGGGFLGGIFGGGEKPKVIYQPVADTEEAKRKAKAGRSALYETDGGVTGSELNPDEVKRRNTLLGN